jgi:hypothetical protein
MGYQGVISESTCNNNLHAPHMNVHAVPRIKLGLMIDVYLDAMMRLMSVTIDSKIFREDKISDESPLFHCM